MNGFTEAHIPSALNTHICPDYMCILPDNRKGSAAYPLNHLTT